MRARPPRRKGQPAAVGVWVERVLGELGLGEVSRAHRIGEAWPDAVGPEIACHCRPAGLRGEVLEVEVESPVWAQQLQLQKPALLRTLREALGDLAPQELHFQVGYRRRAAAPGRPGQPGRYGTASGSNARSAGNAGNESTDGKQGNDDRTD